MTERIVKELRDRAARFTDLADAIDRLTERFKKTGNGSDTLRALLAKARDELS